MARGKKPPQPGRVAASASVTADKWWVPAGGDDFLLDRTGGGFSDAMNQGVMGAGNQAREGTNRRTIHATATSSPTMRRARAERYLRIALVCVSFRRRSVPRDAGETSCRPNGTTRDWARGP